MMTSLRKSFFIPFLSSTTLRVSYNTAILAASRRVPEPELTSEELLSFVPFKNWLTTLEANVKKAQSKGENYILKELEIQSIDFFGERIGFLKLKPALVHPNGKDLPGITVLRGSSVGMLVILQESDTIEKTKYVALVQQPRVPAASTDFLEIPAGMIDESVSSSGDQSSQGQFTGAAARELEEEIGITIPASSLIDLAPFSQPLYMSPGLLDETMKLYLHETKLPQAEIKAMQGKLRERIEGSENEVINLRVVKLKDMWTMKDMRDIKSLLALTLYDKGLWREQSDSSSS